MAQQTITSIFQVKIGSDHLIAAKERLVELEHDPEAQGAETYTLLVESLRAIAKERTDMSDPSFFAAEVLAVIGETV